MCGIAGIVNLGGAAPPPADILKRMMMAVGHRGPDESGIYLDDRAGMGHARLSIIDLSGGFQPIHNEDETLWIVFNGEIFNYPELRRDLVARGHRFLTATDTEVILHLYEERGPACLDEFNGQFAFAIWDTKKKVLFLARDRVGIRPLHYTVRNGRLVFASEIKSLFQCPDVPRRIDPFAMDQIFTFWTPLPGRTVFEGVEELPPGHYLVVADGRIDVRRFWDVPFVAPEERLDWAVDRICEHAGELLKDAIRIRLRADVPVGCYLSGGLDSSGIAALVHRHFNNRLRTFGVRFDEKDFDEGQYQDRMVSFLGTEHTEVRAGNAEIGEGFRDVVWHCEKPVLRTAPVPLFLLSGAVRRNGFKVVLTGEGADEIFGGYNIFRETLVRTFWSRFPRSRVRPLLIGKLYPYIFDDPRLRKTMYSFFGNGIDRPNDPFFSHRIRWDNTRRAAAFFSDGLKETIGDYDRYEDLAARLPDRFADGDPLSRAQYLETTLFLSNYLLSSQGDRVAMAHSVEIRLPYLDFRMIEFLGRVPSKHKIRGMNEKRLLKKILSPVLPPEIVERAKHPYRAPIRQSLLDGSNHLPDALSELALRAAGLFDPGKVHRLIEKMHAGRQTTEVDGMALAGILSAQLLYEQFISSFRDSTHPSSRAVVIDRRTQAA